MGLKEEEKVNTQKRGSWYKLYPSGSIGDLWAQLTYSLIVLKYQNLCLKEEAWVGAPRGSRYNIYSRGSIGGLKLGPKEGAQMRI